MSRRRRAGSGGVDGALLGRTPATCALVNDSQSGGEEASASPLIPNVRDGRIRRILDMIESDSSCKVAGLAAKFNLSESRLQHLFKQKTGLGLGRLLTERRLRKAAFLLTCSSLRIKEIAAAVGYEHTSSFTRAFEQRFAQAPQVYRTRGRLEVDAAEARRIAGFNNVR